MADFYSTTGTVTVTPGAEYDLLRFESDGSLVLTAAISAHLLVVAGGGAGNSFGGGGGGGGGVASLEDRALAVGTYDVVVGAGGVNVGPTEGSPSSFSLSGAGTPIAEADGGDHGSTGSGGAAGGASGAARIDGVEVLAVNPAKDYNPGGGSGAGAAASDRNGANGLASGWFGIYGFGAGGGGGGQYAVTTGGIDGGGQGGPSPVAGDPQHADALSGSGGGGFWNGSESTRGLGGSGVVYVRVYHPAGPGIVGPNDVDVFEGASASFSVFATGSGPLSYQWYEITSGLIAGATAATYAFSAALSDDGNSYYCEVTDDNGTKVSATASLLVYSKYPVEVDPYFDSVSLLLPLDGADASTAFPDASLNSHAVVPAGGAAITTGQSKFGGASVHLDGSSQSLNFPREALVDDPALTTISQAITIECWIYRTAASTSYEYILGATNYTTPFDGLNFQAGPTNRLRAIARNAGAAAFTIEAASLIPLNEWVHAALTRSASGVWTIWQNGVEEATTTETIEVSLRAALVPKIGRDAETGFYWSGWIDDFKITRGVELYTQGFVPPATAHPTSRFAPGLEPAILDANFADTTLLLHFDGSLVDASPAARDDLVFVGNAAFDGTQFKFGDQSISFDGSGARILVPAFDGIRPGTGDFTVEAWIRFAAAGDTGLLGGSSSNDMDIAFIGNEIRIGRINTAWDSSASFTRATGVWYHVAVSRKSGTVYFFIDGALVGSASNSISYTTGTNMYLGTSSEGDRNLNGNIDDFRFTKGVARYTSDFTVPTEAFPDFEYDPLERLDLRTEVDPLFDYNALLLHCEGTAGTAIFTNVVDGLDATAINGAQIGSVDPKVGGGCLALGTTGQHLSYPEKPLYYLGDKLFTIEAWIYVNAHRGGTVNPIIIALIPNGGGAGTCWQLQFEPSGTILFQRWNGSAWQVMLSYTTPLATGAWVHLAVVREGMGAADIKLYIGGTFAKTSTANYTDLETQVTGATELLIGGKSESQYGGAIDGKLDEVRITIGAARYTADFTVPTEAFPDSRYIYADPGPTITAQPVAESVTEGDTASFTVAATGAGTLTYQWHETTAGAIAGATAATYSFVTAVAQDGDGYFCVVTDDVGSSTSITAALAVAGELLAGVTPTTVTVYPNADPVFTCTAVGGTGTKTYQWYGPGGLELSGETGTTLTLVDVVLGDSGKTFYCVVADDLDNVESNHATLVVEAPPALVVSVSPANDAAISGEDVTFTCSAVGGSGTKSYQWFESTAGALGGETGAALTITTTFPDHGNTYYCEVTDDYQTEATGIATLWVYPVLAIDAQPVGGAVGAGDPVTLTVTIAAGTAPYSYQWYQDGNAVTNETAPTLMMIATPGRAGDYTVNITDSTGQMVISDTATLTVSILAPIILTQPGSPRVNKGSSAQFEVSARGYGPLGYQWYRDGFAVSGATGYRYVLGPVTLEDDGAELYCIVTDGYGHSTQSDPGTLTVIRVHLDDQTEPMPASDIGPQKKPTYKHADFSGLVRAAKRGQSPFLPTYRFSGRTFKERE